MPDQGERKADGAGVLDPLVEALFEVPELSVNSKVCLMRADDELTQAIAPLVGSLETGLPKTPSQAEPFDVVIWCSGPGGGLANSEEIAGSFEHVKQAGAVVVVSHAADGDRGVLDLIANVSAAGCQVALHRGSQDADGFSVIAARRLPLKGQAAGPAALQLDCFMEREQQLDIAPAPLGREWMEATNDQFAYRCLPLNIANAYGWELLSPSGVTAIWNGGPRVEDITVAHDDEDAPQAAMSHFGHGVLTFSVRGLFRTEPGFDLWAGGPVNRPKKHAYALTGIIETDWLEFTFTMNWLMTTPNFPVRFHKDEPFCMIHPLPRGLIERFDPQFRPIDEKPDLAEAFRTYRASRNAFNADLKVEGSEARRQKWQRNYFRGPEEAADIDPPHRTKVKLRPFRQ